MESRKKDIYALQKDRAGDIERTKLSFPSNCSFLTPLLSPSDSISLSELIFISILHKHDIETYIYLATCRFVSEIIRKPWNLYALCTVFNIHYTIIYNLLHLIQPRL